MTREAPDRSEKVWFKIGEASRFVGATPKELRYWEKVIPELCPRRSKGNLRYYHQEELLRLQRIRQWLSEGFTVSDCRELLQGVEPAAAKASPVPHAEAGRADAKPSRPGALKAALAALHSLHHRLGLAPGAPIEAPLPASAAPPKKLRSEPAERVIETPVPGVAEPEDFGLLAGLQEPEASEQPEIQKPTPESRTPKKARKPKTEVPVLGRMWSEARLPLDLDE